MYAIQIVIRLGKRKRPRDRVTISSGFIVCNSADRRASTRIYVAYGYLSPFRYVQAIIAHRVALNHPNYYAAILIIASRDCTREIDFK